MKRLWNAVLWTIAWAIGGPVFLLMLILNLKQEPNYDA
jgi:hypothetical protein